MDKKLKQVTDIIHDTIYLSDLESQLISTPYFYRLHEVYQSSTVYLTFSSNRTKRYEHSLGVMDLTSRIFYSAIANASSKDRNSLLDYLLAKVIEIIKGFFEEEDANVNYIKENADSLRSVLVEWKKDHSEAIEKDDNIKELIAGIMRESYIEDTALRHYMIYSFNSSLSDQPDEDIISDIVAYSFVYQCTLQAIRICALFHDVGHPPYSHVIECVLKDLLVESKSAQDKENKKVEQFKKCLERYEISKNDLHKNGLNLLLQFDSESVPNKMHLHESVGVGILLNAMESELKNVIISLKYSIDDRDLGRLFYHIIVLEFTFAILLEKSQQFKSLHKIVDGPFDADKLDYVVRDTINCGVDWGKAPYKRIIESAVLRRPDDGNPNIYAVTYPEKIADDIEDILITRYKIYIRINYHHRVTKTATVLQNAVTMLAKDYLSSDKGEELSPEIEYLWKSIQATNYSKELKIAKWSDSWLMMTLYDTLVKIESNANIKKIAEEKHKNINELEVLRDLLEEVLLNKRHYFTLIKRKSDSVDLLKNILEKAGLTDTLLDKLGESENNRFINSTDKKERMQAKDSLFRINRIKDAKESGLFELLDIAFPHDIFQTIRKVLEDDPDIKDFHIVDNEGRDKFGIQDNPSSWDEKIFLFADNKVVEYNRVNELMNQLKALRNTAVEKYCYVSVNEDIEIDSKLNDIIEKVTAICAEKIKKRFIDNYPKFAEENQLTTGEN